MIKNDGQSPRVPGASPVTIGEPVNQTPNVTPADVEAAILVEHFFTAADGYRGASGFDPAGVVGGGPLSLVTFCVLVTHNGHTVVGEAHCQDPAKFSTAIGREAARADAIRQLWPMVVYAARDRLKPADMLLDPRTE